MLSSFGDLLAIFSSSPTALFNCYYGYDYGEEMRLIFGWFRITFGAYGHHIRFFIVGTVSFLVLARLSQRHFEASFIIYHRCGDVVSSFFYSPDLFNSISKYNELI